MGSRSVPATHRGMNCVNSLSFGMVHGPNAAVGTIQMEGSVTVPLGTVASLQVGSASFVGSVVRVDKKQSEDTGIETSIQVVDWRDRLHDSHLYGAFNMQENDGRFYHIIPDDWLTQTRTYVTKELQQFDFNRVQQLAGTNAQLKLHGKDKLFSAATLLNAIAVSFNFVWTAERTALNILLQSRPINLDWNDGARVADAINELIERCNLQFTCFGANRMHVTLRGWSENAFLNSFLAGLGNICQLGATDGTIGNEVNTLGRRIIIVGDKNKYEFLFPCVANWNPRFTWELVYGGWGLSALLEAHGLTLHSKLRELPVEYHDDQTWPEGSNDLAAEGAADLKRSRLDMKIEDYINKVCFHTYMVDFTAMVTELKPVHENVFSEETLWQRIDPTTFEPKQEDDEDVPELPFTEWELFGIQVIPNPDDPLDPTIINGWNSDQELASRYPLSAKLNTDSNLQFICYSTSRRIPQGIRNPLDAQFTLTPKDSGVNLDVEESVGKDGRPRYITRLLFSEPQFFLDLEQDFRDPLSVQPDRIVVRLNLERELFIWTQGEQGNRMRVREQRKNVRNLYRAFVKGTEVAVLADNYRFTFTKKHGVRRAAFPIKARDIALRIASQMLFHQAVTRTGSLQFRQTAGYHCDGVVDSVNCNYNGDSGVGENVNFTSIFNDDDDLSVPFMPLTVSRKTKLEDDIIRDRLEHLARQAARAAAQQARAAQTAEQATHRSGGLFGAAHQGQHFGRDGNVRVKITQTVYSQHDLKPATLIAIGPNNGESEILS